MVGNFIDIATGQRLVHLHLVVLSSIIGLLSTFQLTDSENILPHTQR